LDANADGRIAALWRFPVKSMLGERLEAVKVTGRGLLGDRAYALVDGATGKVASAKHTKLWAGLLRCRAAFVEPLRPGAEPPPVRIQLADGTSVTSDAPDVDAVLSRHWGRDVELARAAREDGSFVDAFPVSVLTTSTLDRLNELAPQSTFDARRFRMNLIVETPPAGFAENAWVGRGLGVGEEVELSVAIPDPRCALTNMAQEELPRDPQILKTLARHNTLEVAGAGLQPCAGVYAVVTSSGTVRAGDPVKVT